MKNDKLFETVELFEKLTKEASEIYEGDPLIKIAPNWATDEDKWERAKKIIQKRVYLGKLQQKKE